MYQILLVLEKSQKNPSFILVPNPLLHSQTCDGDLRVSTLDFLGEVANKQQTLNASTDVL